MEQQTAERILATARQLVIAGGYNGFSYADIAAVVGIRKPSIHHHFPSKADLVQALVAGYRDDLAAGLAHFESLSPDAAVQLQSYIATWEACITDGSMPFCLGAQLAAELPALPPEVAVEVKAHFRLLAAWLTEVLARGAQQGRFRLTASAELEAETIMATVHGAMLSARAYGTPATFGLIVGPLLQRLII
ncbi:TetR/AcrR family transcriptional regulator [Devosia sp. LjRoot16]|uniref:TetR/AcrR family transcriptional regulator n=1 Tax=Devosia sp. LjRoot16 TaxID=3342271 RepID=UPI003ECCEAC5